MNDKGIISIKAAGAMGSGNPFDIPTNIQMPAKEPLLENTEPKIYSDARAESPDTIERVTTQPKEDKKASSGYYFIESLKEKGKFDGENADKAISIEDAVDRIYGDIMSKKDQEISEILEAKGYNDPELLKYSKLLKSGMSPNEQNELADLNRYLSASVDVETEVGRKNAVFLVHSMLKDQLKGSSLRLATDEIHVDMDPDRLSELTQEALSHVEEKKQGKLKSYEDRENKKEAEETAFSSKVKDVVLSGNIGQITLDKKEAQKMADKIFKPTEVVTIKDEDGQDQVIKVSKYQKNLLSYKNDPVKMALLQALIADDLDLKIPISKGESAAHKNLEDVLGLDIPQKQKQEEAIARSINRFPNNGILSIRQL